MRFAEVKELMLDKLARELPANLTYHSLGHVKDVYQAAERFASLEGVAGEDLTLLLTAVVFHDSGFLKEAKEHEQTGCDIARATLPAYDYTAEQIERICGMIMATRIPQTPHNLSEQIICDADLDYLGRDDFYKIGQTLFQELRTAGVLATEDEWNRLQVKFLEAHHYFTASALRLRKPVKDKYLEDLKRQIGQ